MTQELLTNPIIQDVFLAVLAALGTVVTAALATASRSAVRWLESKSHGAAFAGSIQKIETLTINAVDEVEQTLVRQLKADKKWDAETAKQARDTAVSIAMRHLGTRGAAEVQASLGLDKDKLEGMLRTLVEKYVGSTGTKTIESPKVALGK